MRELLIACALVVLFSIALDKTVPYDDTDDASNGVRSGMMIYTDHYTGCQYLGKLFGGVTPRLSRKGEHMGCFKEEK